MRNRILLFGCLLVCSLPLQAARRRAAVPGRVPVTASPSGVIAFVSERDANAEIYVMNADGTGLTRLTHYDGFDREPAWSPDGSRIAFVSDRAGWGPDIYVMDADGSNVVRKTENGSSSSPAWSPDGTKIAFASVRDGGFLIQVMSVDGDWANPTLVGYDRGFNASPAWSPDGSQIAFVSDSRAYDFVYDVHVMNADGSRPTVLIAGPFFGPWTYYFQPAWSPDGNKIAVVGCPHAWENCYPDSFIAVANADGSALKTLAPTNGYARPAWSPDSSTIAYTSEMCSWQCVPELRFVSADGTRSGVIFWNGRDPAWRPQPVEVTP